MTYKPPLRSISPSYGGPVAEWRGGLPRNADPAEEALEEAEAVAWGIPRRCCGELPTAPRNGAATDGLEVG